MEQILHFSCLSVSDSLDETFSNEEDTITRETEDNAQLASQPSKTELSDEDSYLVLDSLFLSNSGHVKTTRYENLSLSSNIIEDTKDLLSRETCQTANNSDTRISDEKFPQGSTEHYGIDRWSRHHERPNLFIRNQSRTSTETQNVSESDIVLSQLLIENPAMNTVTASFYFNATSWPKAIKTIECGIKIEERLNDLSDKPAFYCNPDYPNSYEWLYKKKGSFGGEHAILIYRFDPWSLSNRGEKLTDKEWKSVVYKRNTKKRNPDWSEAPQNKAPGKCMNQGKHPIPCRLSDGRTAKQLVVRKQALCNKMNVYLVGCVFYEKLNVISGMFSIEPPIILEKLPRYSYERRKKKRQLSKDRSKIRDLKRTYEE